MPDINQTFEMLRVNSKPKVVRAELDDMYTATSNSLRYAVQGMDKMQERAMKAIDARNQLAAQMAQLNANEGEDSKRLAAEIQTILDDIDNKVAEDGHWVYADKTVSKAATDFATNQNVKHLLQQKANRDGVLEDIEKNSDADASTKAAYIQYIDRLYNEAGGAFDKNGSKQSYTSFGFRLGKGHDMNEYRDAILKVYKEMKPSSTFSYSENMKKQLLGIVNNSNVDESVKHTASKLMEQMPYYIYGQNKQTWEGITEDKMMQLAQAIVNADPRFRTAMQHEAILNLDNYHRQGISTEAAITKELIPALFSNTIALQTLVTNSDEYKTASDKDKRQMLANPTSIGTTSLLKSMESLYGNLTQNDDEDENTYNTRMTNLYTRLYGDDKLNSVMEYSKQLAFEKSDVDVKNHYLDTFNKEAYKKRNEDKDKLKNKYAQLYTTNGSLTAESAALYDQDYRSSKDQINLIDLMLESIKDDDEREYLNNRKKELEMNRDAYVRGYSNRFNSLSDGDKIKAISNLETTLFSELGSSEYWFLSAKTREMAKIYKRSGFALIVHKAIDNVKNNPNFKYEDVIDDIKEQITKDFQSGDSDLINQYDGDLTTILSKLENNKYSYLNNILAQNNIYEDARNISYIGSVNSGSETLVSQAAAPILATLASRPGTYKVIAAELRNGKGDKITNIQIDDANDNFGDFFSIDKSNNNKTVYANSNIEVNLGVTKDGTFILDFYRPIQGESNQSQHLICTTSDPDAIANIEGLANSMLITAYNNNIESSWSPAVKNTYNRLLEGFGAAARLTGNISNSIERKYSDAFGGMKINNNICYTIGEALEEFTKQPITSATTETFYSNNARVIITKNLNGTYYARVDAFDGKKWVKADSEKYSDAVKMQTDILMVIGSSDKNSMLKEYELPSYEWKQIVKQGGSKR
ncbi:MAG: hypothetical protein HDQ88_04705 [Clostridia bacterium]|nr:hypothetical protein [Clostridia bacterium]